MKQMLRLIIFTIIIFIFIKASTLGWRFGSKIFTGIKKEDLQLREKLKSHVYKLSTQIGERSVFNDEKLNAAAEYITEQFRSFGYDVEFQEYKVFDKITKNIIAFKKGIKNPEEIIILGAHYDTCLNPGADDNASGVAGLLELARLFADKKILRSIKFVAFVNEEPPFFKSEEMGSRVYARRAKSEKENIRGVLILESVGYYSDKPYSQRYPLFFGLFYPNRGNFIAVVGNFASQRLVKEVTTRIRQQSRIPVESLTTFGFITGVDFSDNWSFWKEGYAAVMITDTAFYRNPHYHLQTDTDNTLNYNYLTELVKGLQVTLTALVKE